MTDSDTNAPDRQFLRNAMASFVQIGALVLLLSWCYRILSPFIGILLWAIIIAVSIYPAYLWLKARLGGRGKTAAIVLVVIGLAILLIPTWLVAESTITGLRTFAHDFQDGSVTINPPSPTVAEWPLIGDKVYELWSEASENLEETVNQFAPLVRQMGEKAVAFAGGSLITVLQFVLSICIAGALFTHAEGGYRLACSLGTALVGKESGFKLTDMSIQTIRSVFKGVLIVMGPVAFWVFSVAEPVPATLFAVYAVVVSVSDAFLKPMLLGRGVEVPMLVILLGAIGGAITGGIIGLFVGAVVLALGYEILRAWLNLAAPEPPEAPAAST
jgi:predicted PurR-regulated permease PerM